MIKVNRRVFQVDVNNYSSLSSEDSLLLIRLLPGRVFPRFGPETNIKMICLLIILPF